MGPTSLTLAKVGESRVKATFFGKGFPPALAGSYFRGSAAARRDGGLIAKFAPNGRLEEETIATMARLMWRRQNLGQLSYLTMQRFRETGRRKPGRKNSKQDDELISEKGRRPRLRSRLQADQHMRD
jgi:hypothetical protein